MTPPPHNAEIGADFQPREETSTPLPTYLGDRIDFLEAFALSLEQASPRTRLALPRGTPFAQEIEGPTTVSRIKEYLRQLKRQGETLREPRLLAVQDTFFPCILLTSGWWERGSSAGRALPRFDDKVQEWLFKGFDLWAPSWDLSLAAASETGAQTHLVGQLGSGDEADSIPVLVARSKAAGVLGLQGDDAVMSVTVTGVLKHVSHCSPEERGALATASAADEDDSAEDVQEYCLVVEEHEPLHDVARRLAMPDLYSGYLWQCWGPRASLERDPRLDEVYFIWEHTNFSSSEALKYNLDALQYKVSRLTRRIDNPILMQKSHSRLVPDTPQLSTRQFYDLLFKRQLSQP
jgi:hypothetical protein